MVYVVMWNIEQLGLKFPMLHEFRDELEGIRETLVARLIYDMGADVIIIQELTKRGIPALGNICTKLNVLNNVYAFDWIPGGIKSADFAEDPSFQYLDFCLKANGEGYGVIWRNNVLSRIEGAPSAGAGRLGDDAGENGNNYISLVNQGYLLNYYDNESIKINYSSNPVNPLNFPESCTGPLYSKGFSLRPRKNKKVRKKVSNKDLVQKYLNVRRPCFVRINGGVNCVTYHTPVGSKSSNTPLYATLIGFAANQLSAAFPETTSALYGGDMNLKTDVRQSAAAEAAISYEYEEVPINDDGDATGTMIKYWSNGKRNKFWRNGSKSTNINGNVLRTNYCTSARDYMFGIKYNNAVDFSYDVFDIVSWFIRGVRTPGGINFPNQTIQYLNDEEVRQALITLAPYPKVSINGVTIIDILTAFNENKTVYPKFTDKFTAISFIYNYFISDHLPVVMRVDGPNT